MKIEVEHHNDPNVITYLLPAAKITFHQSRTTIEANDPILRKKISDIILEDLY